ncbi:hypothetical protein Scep_010904 [Stephania cephalantha]|uniref:Uncharacterized protein n=1 Tax=Stephania cephalantha TaxID=152367 RepID=A0AAP0JW16_9MAGN
MVPFSLLHPKTFKLSRATRELKTLSVSSLVLDTTKSSTFEEKLSPSRRNGFQSTTKSYLQFTKRAAIGNH